MAHRGLWKVYLLFLLCSWMTHAAHITKLMSSPAQANCIFFFKKKKKNHNQPAKGPGLFWRHGAILWPLPWTDTAIGTPEWEASLKQFPGPAFCFWPDRLPLQVTFYHTRVSSHGNDVPCVSKCSESPHHHIPHEVPLPRWPIYSPLML